MRPIENLPRLRQTRPGAIAVALRRDPSRPTQCTALAGARKVIIDRHLTLPRLAKMDVGVSVVGGILDGWNGYMAMELMGKEGVTVKSRINWRRP